MAVSVVMPARNSAATLSRALESLAAQSFGEWEAIVVDDGSTDDTGDRARGWAEREPRVRLVEQPASGVSAARNAGIAAARHPLLLFLDADDELLPGALTSLVAAVEDDPQLAGAYGRWARVAPSGRVIELYPAAAQDGDIFSLLATYCVFAIHTCVVRREAVERVGPFDTTLRTCEDWDLWQRIARAGGRFAHVPEPVALYHLSASSASADPTRLLADGLLVAERGHTRDSRLAGLEQAYPDGAPDHGLAAAQALLACWSAGLAVANGTDPLPLLDMLPAGPVPDLDPLRAGRTMYETTVRLQPLGPAEVADQWEMFGRRARIFLEALERRLAVPGLTTQALRTMERSLILDCPDHRPVVVGETFATRVELTEPVQDLDCPPGTDRATVALTAQGATVGVTELPAVDGVVPCAVLTELDATAAWRLLGAFFAATVFADRGSDASERFTIHESSGWIVFLQELWDRGSWSEAAFYDPTTRDAVGPELHVETATDIEVADELPTLVSDAISVAVTIRVGGRAIGVVDVDPREGRVPSQRLRAELTTASGFELCRVAVCQALVGMPLEGASLRERLLARSGERQLGRVRTSSLLGRHPHAPIGSTAARRAWLPGSTAPDVALIATLTGQPFVRGLSSAGILYVPDVVGSGSAETPSVDGSEPLVPSSAVPDAYGRHHFEQLLASERDPWQYESAYERRKYEHTLELIPRGARRALEIGCAEGHFTVDLAPLVHELVAADLSEIALGRARARCAGLENISFQQLDVAADLLPGRFDVIVCSELLYYVGRARLPTVAEKLADGLVPGGTLVLAHANLQVDEPDEPGFDWALPYGAAHIGDVLTRQRSLRLVRELRTPFYRVQRYERRRAPIARRRPPEPEQVPYEEPVDEVAAHFRWTPAPAAARHVAESSETWHLPILMYHRVADDGPAATARWRVDVESFARQLDYLADAGFRTVTFDAWRAATTSRRPLPGRAVILTFDDGYVDFAANAWPLLEQRGFGAVLAVVADRVGGVADWDSAYGEPAPLLDWPAIRELATKGIEIASHATSHTPLTALPLADAARECSRSRLVLERELGRRVSTLVYPHGAHDPVIEHIAGGLGYAYGLSSDPGLARLTHRHLSLPRQEIRGDMSFDEFVRTLTPDD